MIVQYCFQVLLFFFLFLTNFKSYSYGLNNGLNNILCRWYIVLYTDNWTTKLHHSMIAAPCPNLAFLGFNRDMASWDSIIFFKNNIEIYWRLRPSQTGQTCATLQQELVRVKVASKFRPTTFWQFWPSINLPATILLTDCGRQ
jgi:hypothetical protein